MPSQINAVADQINSIILGKSQQIRLAIACLLARGHLLIEDVPGVGKTTLAHAIATSLGLKFQRIQFTSDLLPADILGVSVYNRDSGSFEFHPGPVFTNVVLADEVNRATPRAQSALLEAMEENQVTTEGETRLLPRPFFVIATQNPSHQIGTFPLPESQLDRFLMRIELGYPDPRHERTLLAQRDRRELLSQAKPALDPATLLALQKQAAAVHVAEPLIDYVQKLVAATRARADLRLGLSPRAAQGLVRAARAWALIEGREAVLPDDVQAVWPSVALHRLEPRAGFTERGALSRDKLVRSILESVAVPR
jgi:MoxR-like ATPase